MLTPQRSDNQENKQTRIGKKQLALIFATVTALALLIPLNALIQSPAAAQAQPPEPALKCYPIFSPRVTVKDQFGTERVNPGPKQWLCEAALKHSDVAPPGSHQWKMYTISGKINPPKVQLQDQFGTEIVDPATGSRLLNPTLKNDKGNLQDTHMKGYPITGTIDPPSVLVADQFGTETVNPGKATFLITPAQKDGAGDLAAPHWKCYPISGTINPPPVSLQDQFGTEKVDPGKAELLCTLTQKTIVPTGAQSSPEPVIAASEE